MVQHMMKSKLSVWCDTLLELCWLLAVIIAPLFFNIHSERVFEPDKITLIRSLAVLASTTWLIKFINEEGWQEISWLKWSTKSSIWRIPFVLPVALLAVSYLVSAAFSVTPSVSWLGSYQRLQGTYTTLSYLVIFATLVATIRTDAQIRRVITLIIITSIPVCLYGFLQRTGHDPLPWGGNTQIRIAGHMGNAIFIAAYLIMAFPLTLARIISSFTNILSDEDLSPADIIRSSIYIFTLAIQLMAIYWSQSRGPLLGLMIGVFAFISIFLVALRNNAIDTKGYTGRDLFFSTFGVITGIIGFTLAVLLRPQIGDLPSLILFFAAVGVAILAVFVLIALRQGWKWLWISWITLAVFVALWLGAFNLSRDLLPTYGQSPVVGPPLQTLEAWRKLPSVGRYGSLLDADSNNARVRTLIWKGALNLITPHDPIEFPNGETDTWNFLRPLVGYGPEAMYVAYNSFYPPELATVEARNASPDRSHNETFDALVITGLFGFLVWQWLYLTVFYYSFRWLGVVSSTRDRNVLIGLWIGGGVLAAVALSSWRSLEYMGIGYPFGTILGLALYLIYYAIFSRPNHADTIDPFRSDRLMMIALLGAILAHYVEIHFGIAIVSTRVHFFVFIGLLLAMGHLLPAEPILAEKEPEETASTSRRGRSAPAEPNKQAHAGPVYQWLFLLGIMVAILGYNFTIYSPKPGQTIQSLNDLPTAAEIMQQSLFIQPNENFADSPYIFLLILMTWGLGSLIVLCEMVKNETLHLPTPTNLFKANQTQLLTAVFALATLACLGLFGWAWTERADPAALTLSMRIGALTLAPLGAIISTVTALTIWRAGPLAPQVAGGVAALLLAITLPFLVAQAYWPALIALAVAILIFYWTWENTAVWALIKPTLTITLGSLTLGWSFMYLHAGQVRQSMIIPAGINELTPEIERRIAEALQFSTILSFFYIFLFFLLLVFASWIASQSFARRNQNWGTILGFSALFLLVGAFFFIRETNLQVIQADMVYKRGKPWDTQAARQTGEEALRLWNNAIAVYEAAIGLTPREDFYYLWLGRAYLEKSALSANPAQRDIVLQTAEASLQNAQQLNPLNTDHTANLARLNTRWASVVQEEERETRISNANNYYQDAIKLSPQNAVIRNEYARLTYTFEKDCDQTIELYKNSMTADPFYFRTRFELAEVYLSCAQQAEGEAKIAYYGPIVDVLREGTQLAQEKPGREFAQAQAQPPRSWLQAAQFFQESAAWSYAIIAYDTLANWPADKLPEQLPQWRAQFLLANAYKESGDVANARTWATTALAAAPSETQGQIQQFIDNLTQ